MRRHKGSCHCGQIRFEVDASEALELDECNCSICVKAGYLHVVVPKERFRLTAGKECLTTYKFNTGVARHPFCSVCGIKSFYFPRAYPQGVSINACCIDQTMVKSMSVARRFDGANWEECLSHYEPPTM
ncbi:MAG: GFA family protein [Gammaproteobacteria bacterium]|nr:GFA family protein [Gammaproteobacteria bacterium]